MTGSTRLRSTFDVQAKREQAAALERKASEPNIWEDPASAQDLTTRLARLRDALGRFDSLARQLGDLRAMDDLLADEQDPEMTSELRRGIERLGRDLDRVELEALLSGEYDSNDAVASLHAGAGGTESQDWAEMLLRMFLRWAERRGYDAELDEVVPGEEAGLKSATFIVHGPNAYGFLSAERGVHRLVRISPFDASKRRHTSFASLDVIPLLADDEELEIDPKDLRVDTFRASSAGGQHVNVTDSAVRITHIPTGIAAACQNERSQMQNRAVAMRILKARLADLARRERAQRIEDLRGEQRGIDFGSQIRSYVLHPYRMVKDHRTGQETSDVDRTLDGDLDAFIDAYLRHRASGDGSSAT